MKGKRIACIGTLDTKGEEIFFLKRLIEERGHHPFIIDIGILNPPFFSPDISREDVLKMVDIDIHSLLALQDEGKAIEWMTKGLIELVKKQYERGEIDGVIGIGGGQGSAICSFAMRQLPIGFPKLLVSTKVAQAGLRGYVGSKDIVIIPSVSDIAGLNRLTQKILANAASCIVGMVEYGVPVVEEKPLVVMSMLGTTTECGLMLKKFMEEDGYEVIVFHAIGVGGEAMEEFMHQGNVECVVELAVNEVGNELFGGLATAGPQRMEAAGELGIPQVITPGNADFINFLSFDTVPFHYQDRKIHRHNPQATTMRLNDKEMEILGKVIAEKLNKAKGKIKAIIPCKGFSAWDKEKGVFFDPQADRKFIQSLKYHLDKKVELKEVELHINSPNFAEILFNEFKILMKTESPRLSFGANKCPP